MISVYDKAGNVYIYPFYYFFKISFIDQSIDSLIEKKQSLDRMMVRQILIEHLQSCKEIIRLIIIIIHILDRMKKSNNVTPG